MSEALPGIPAPPPARPAPLFYERGASWCWLLAGPVAAVALLLVQNSNGMGLQPLLPMVFLVLVSGFLAIQVKAARTHVSVELTEETLRQGTETIRVADIVWIFPEPKNSADPLIRPERWQDARALGELSGVPRRRVGIGLQLTARRTVQAWARNPRGLRAALIPLVQQRSAELVEPSLEADDDGESLW